MNGRNGADELRLLAWRSPRLGEGVAALARRAGLTDEGAPVDIVQPPEAAAYDTLTRWLERAAMELGLEAEPTIRPYAQLRKLVRTEAPAILRLPGPDTKKFLLLVSSRRTSATLLAPDLTLQHVPAAALWAALVEDLEAPVAAETATMLATVDVPEARRARARAALLKQRLGATQVWAGWTLRLAPGRSGREQAHREGLFRYLITFAGAYAAQYLLFLLAWWALGRAVFGVGEGRPWLWVAAVLLLTLVPFRVAFTRAQGLVAVRAGALLKRRLLYGVLQLEPDEIRHQGTGQLLGRVIESEAVESLALSGGFLGLVALIELVAAALVLRTGAMGRLHLTLLLGWFLGAAVAGWLYYKNRSRWTDTRLHMTHDLVEQMVGHRTRLAQGAPARIQAQAQRTLTTYRERSQKLDRVATLLTTVIPRGWLLLGLGGLAPAVVAPADTVAVAVSLGGVILATRALGKVASSLTHLAAAAIAWRQVRLLYQAATRPRASGSPLALQALVAGNSPSADNRPLLEGHSLLFRYREKGAPALHDCTFHLGRDERVLLEGESGSGKSTLVSLIAGLREADEGLLFLDGFDNQALGETWWRQRVAAAPQFHENHVFAGPLAFNLLMGRRWPPRAQDLQEAEAVCRELGLGPLLDEMPGGLMQPVGDTGWQLSHGERSRLYIARALLQETDLVVLDESFAALDPDSLRHALQAVLERAPALLVIAHP